ncbi:MAG: hypothetical protein LBI68_02175 [Azoarcus sp.]|jgi:hypothetical protein|nr:hypothetical protein [Azoarcus sp.]
MNQNAAMLLMLLCMFAAWVWTWSVIATRRTVRGKNRFIAHLIGVLAGSSAAFGAFCLSGALLMPGAGDGASIAIGVFGALVLCTYLGALHSPKQKVSQSAEAEPAVPMVTAVGMKTDTTPVSRVPRKPFKDSLQTWWQEEKRRQGEFLQQEERKRVAREKALGMTFGTFFSERAGDHFMFWCGVLFLIVWGCLFAFVPSSEDWLTRLVVSFIVACLLAAVWGVSCIVIVPAILLLLALLPFACISILVEAWWRIRHNQPYIAPPVVISYDNIASSSPPRSTGNWLVPLVIGLWIGSAWGKDD